MQQPHPQGPMGLPSQPPPLEPRRPRFLLPGPQSFPGQGQHPRPSLGEFRVLAHRPVDSATGRSCSEREGTISTSGFEHRKASQESPLQRGEAVSRSEGLLGGQGCPILPPCPQQGSQPSPPSPSHSVTSWFSQEAAAPIRHPPLSRPRAGQGLAWPRRVGTRPPNPLPAWASEDGGRWTCSS